MHAIPEGRKESRLSAYKALDEDHPSLEMPDVETEHSADYLVGLLHEAGLMSSTGMGPVPLSWVEIDAWLNCTQLKLDVWEKLLIKSMSEVYVGERLSATDPNGVPPWTKPVSDEEIEREKISNQLLTFLRNFKRKPKG